VREANNKVVPHFVLGGSTSSSSSLLRLIIMGLLLVPAPETSCSIVIGLTGVSRVCVVAVSNNHKILIRNQTQTNTEFPIHTCH